MGGRAPTRHGGRLGLGGRPLRARVVLAVAVLGLTLLGGCGGSSGEPSAEGSKRPSESGPSPPSAGGPPAPASPSPASEPSGHADVVADGALLAVLPASVDGLALVPIPEAVPEAAADPAVAAAVDRMAFAVAVDPATGDQVVALVAHLRGGSLDPAGFRAWRDSFDRGVCERAGGVVGHAEISLGGRQVAVGICAEGVRTYHILLSDRELVVSAQSLGERRLGERLLAEVEE